ncbi:MAG: GTPase Era [Proteobacteria bacterium]|nr:GTPase Era [Pseudomonadota bacterium]
MKSGFVAIIGRPNVGKSTLVNAILREQLAIVTPKEQTTRHRIIGILNAEGSQIVFLDTPGFHRSRKPLNRAMNEIVSAVMDDADVVCLLVDAASRDHAIERELFGRIGADRCVVVANKSDLVERSGFEAAALKFRDEWGAREMVFVSALRGDGVPELVEAIRERLPEGEPLYPTDSYTAHPVRFLAAEIIRKQLFLQMHEEIPYSAAVEIEEFRDPRAEGELTRIVAAIVVERESQKGMVIGKGGSRIKEIGTRARKEIEELVGGRVFLDLSVRVVRDWTKDPESIKKLGYEGVKS